MSDIKTFPFDINKLGQLKNYFFGRNWPVVYILENSKEAYIGETTSIFNRSKQHFDNVDRRRLKQMHVITDEEYNKSATLDIESFLIQHIAAEGTYRLQNGNQGLLDHDYYDRQRYKAKFEVIWEQLRKMSIVSKDLVQIRNSDLFKYSPYKALTEDQLAVSKELLRLITKTENGTHIVNGNPGTGKTILATFLVKLLKEKEETKRLEVGLVVPMGSLRKTLKRVFRGVEGLSPTMVIGPSEVTNKKYDVLIVDEAHRLRQRRNIMGFGVFDRMNKKLGFGEVGTELDWILKSSHHQIFFYDEKQSIRPADVHAKNFSTLKATHHHLTSQVRVMGGEKYIEFVNNLFDGRKSDPTSFSDYDFRIYDDVQPMIDDIKNKDKELQLCRIVAGYAWEWKSKKDPRVYDIEIGDAKLRWNSVMHDWVNSANAINEVGCIHTVQGYDLNYIGIIVGPELGYDKKLKRLVINKKNYKDANGWHGITDPLELERYIINIYKTLMTRGIKGCYIYFVDKETEKYFKDRIKGEEERKEYFAPMPASIGLGMIRVPLVGSAPCGNPLLGQENIEEYILVEKSKIKFGFNYFILRAEGDSMNLAGINDGDLVLCRQQLKADTGDRVAALLGDNVTIKMYDKKDGRRILLPKSTNKKHMSIMPEEGDSVQGVIQEVLEPQK